MNLATSVVLAGGTSEGAKKGWDTRGRGKCKLGTCYMDAYKAFESGGVDDLKFDQISRRKSLVHGTVNVKHPDGTLGRGGHAWIELGDHLVWDPDSKELFLKDHFYKAAKVENPTHYSLEEMRKQAMKHEVYGPWK